MMKIIQTSISLEPLDLKIPKSPPINLTHQGLSNKIKSLPPYLLKHLILILFWGKKKKTLTKWFNIQ
jgi:hypothetical protein